MPDDFTHQLGVSWDGVDVKIVNPFTPELAPIDN